MDLHLPESKEVKVPFSTYKELVRRSLQEDACKLCFICGEPIWGSEPGRHRCWEVSTEHYTTVNVAQELSELQEREKGLQRLAIQARFETYARHKSDESNGDDPVWNEENDSPGDEDQPVMCKNCSNQKMTEVIPGCWECPTCSFTDFK